MVQLSVLVYILLTERSINNACEEKTQNFGQNSVHLTRILFLPEFSGQLLAVIQAPYAWLRTSSHSQCLVGVSKRPTVQLLMFFNPYTFHIPSFQKFPAGRC